MKIYVGIDIAKLNHFAAAISSDGEIIIEPFQNRRVIPYEITLSFIDFAVLFNHLLLPMCTFLFVQQSEQMNLIRHSFHMKQSILQVIQAPFCLFGF